MDEKQELIEIYKLHAGLPTASAGNEAQQTVFIFYSCQDYLCSHYYNSEMECRLAV